MKPIPKIDADEHEVPTAYAGGQLKSVATEAELAKFKAAARATGVKDRRVNIRLSSSDLRDIQVEALEEGVPHQRLIASVLHKYVAGRLAEPGAAKQSSRPPTKRRATSGCRLLAWVPALKPPQENLLSRSRIDHRPAEPFQRTRRRPRRPPNSEVQRT